MSTVACPPRGRRLPLQLRAVAGAPPLGAIFLGVGIVSGLVVRLLRLDQLPFSVCFFRGITGWPCVTCGSTRALGCLARLDLAAAFAMNPLAVVLAIGIGFWGLADLLLAARGRALSLEVTPALVPGLRAGVIAVVALNWLYLLATGR